jgi:hypothetical protein
MRRKGFFLTLSFPIAKSLPAQKNFKKAQSVDIPVNICSEKFINLPLKKEEFERRLGSSFFFEDGPTHEKERIHHQEEKKTALKNLRSPSILLSASIFFLNVSIKYFLKHAQSV